MNFEIEKLHACAESIKFRRNYPDFKSAWENCPRGDWMLWIAKRLNVDLLKLTTAKALCANTVRHLMMDDRSIEAVEVAILFGQGKASREELNAAADAANAAVYAANAAATAYAAYAAYAANAAADTNAAANAAANAANAAAYAADATKNKSQQETADICRKILTEDVLAAINNL